VNDVISNRVHSAEAGDHRRPQPRQAGRPAHDREVRREGGGAGRFPVGARPGVRVMAKIAGQHPGDALKISLGGSLNLRYEYLFESLGQEEADRYLARCTGESPWAQFQVLLHKPSDLPRGRAPVMVMSTPDDNLIPAGDTLFTARRYSAEHLEFPGIGPT
jgi:hypothetical protein